MKVLLTQDSFLPQLGGAEVHVWKLAKALEELGHQVTIATATPGPSVVDGLRVHRFPMLQGQGIRAVRNDPRTTRIGRWLRRLSVDELPQLWNVFMGQMSLVGPRPERPIHIREYRHEIPGYMLRHKVKAGMTGWAQVHGWRGDTSLHERSEHDIYYIQNWSLGMDFLILTMTLWSIVRGRNAY